MKFKYVGILAIMLAVGMATNVRAEDPGPVSGTIEIDQAQMAFIFSGNFGGGKLKFKGKTYSFKIGGLGVGGIGVSQIHATGEVYKLKSIKDFAGGYGQARAGYAAFEKSGGKLWLENPAGVVMALKAKRRGIALSLGADVVVIKLDK